MFGRLLCWFGWHDWGYRYSTGEIARPYRRQSIRDVQQHLAAHTAVYRCLRCGVRP